MSTRKKWHERTHPEARGKSLLQLLQMAQENILPIAQRRDPHIGRTFTNRKKLPVVAFMPSEGALMAAVAAAAIHEAIKLVESRAATEVRSIEERGEKGE